MAHRPQYGSSRWGEISEISNLREELLNQLPPWMTNNLEEYNMVNLGIRHRGTSHKDAGYGRFAPNEFDFAVDIYNLDEMRDRVQQFAALRQINPNQILVRLKK